MWLVAGQFIRFIVVGLLNTAVDFGLLNLLIYLFRWPSVWANTVSFSVAVLNSFFWNKYWTFKSRDCHISEFIRFNSVYVFVFVVNAITLIILVDIFNMNPKIGQLIALPIITIISFTGHRRWSFKGKQNVVSNPLE